MYNVGQLEFFMLRELSRKLVLLRILILISIISLNQHSFVNPTLIDDKLCSNQKSDSERKKCDFKCLIDKDSSFGKYFSLNISLFNYFSSFVFIFTKISLLIEEKANSPPKIYLFNL